MKQIFSLIVAILNLVVLTSFLLKLSPTPLFELGVLGILVVLLLVSFTAKRNRTLMMVFYALNIANVGYLYILDALYRTNELYLVALLSSIGFFFEFGRAEVVRIPKRERAKLMKKWGMQKIQPIMVDEELQSAKELQKELQKSKEEIKEELRQTKKDIKKAPLELKKAKTELKKEIRKSRKDLKKEIKKSNKKSKR